MDGSVGAFGEQLVFQGVTASVASDDAPDFPEADVVEELTTGYSDFAHEQLIDVVGAGQFFPLSPFPFCGLSSGSPAGML